MVEVCKHIIFTFYIKGNNDNVSNTFAVGFTGSGQAMRKDPTRTRHVYQQNDEYE